MMSWEERLLATDTRNFHSSVLALIRQQLETWPMLREAITGLYNVEYKKMIVKGSEVFAQFNPKRIVSTAAKVDTATIKQRPCFLCVENLPAEERGIPFGDNFIVLCNPFPVLRNHLVLSARTHTPQTIEGNLRTLLDFARNFGDGWFTLYNGPRCGASAPDHLHFQAASNELLPILRDVDEWPEFLRTNDRDVESIDLRNYRLNALIARSANCEALIGWFEKELQTVCMMYQTETGSRISEESSRSQATPGNNENGWIGWEPVLPSYEEPMVNLVAAFSGTQWTLICYPRSRHRPSCYYAEGEAKFTVSPAAIDLSGVIVVPNPDHFARITASVVEQIYAEITLDYDR